MEILKDNPWTFCRKEQKNQSTLEEEKFCKPVKYNPNGTPRTAGMKEGGSYGKLEENGFVKVGTRVNGGDAIIGKCIPLKTMSDDDIAYIEEDLRSPCTQEIAVFRAFAEIVDKSEDEIVVIDTAPTGHTLLLLDSTQSYHKEIERSQGDIPESVKKLLPKLRDENYTEVVVITLAEATPVFEANRLEHDLERAGISSKWWVINSSLYATNTQNQTLRAKANSEIKWINRVNEISDGNFAVVDWKVDEIKGDKLYDLLK